MTGTKVAEEERLQIGSVTPDVGVNGNNRRQYLNAVRADSISRCIIYVVLITGYLFAAVLLGFVIYQHLVPQNDHNQRQALSEYDERSLRKMLEETRGLETRGTTVVPTTVDLEWMNYEEYYATASDEDATVYPIENKVELEVYTVGTTSTPPSTIIPTTITTATTTTTTTTTTTGPTTSRVTSIETAESVSGFNQSDIIMTEPVLMPDILSKPPAATTTMTTPTTTASQTVVSTTIGSSNNVCDTDECVLAAANSIRLLNRDINPCNDFFAYACGRYGESPNGINILKFQTQSSNQRSSHRFPNEIEESYKFYVEQTLEGSNNDSNSHLTKVQDFYQSCMHQSSFTTYLNDLKRFLRNIGSIAFRSTDLSQVIGEFTMREVFPMFGIAVHRPLTHTGQQFVDGRLALTAPIRHLHPFAMQPSMTSVNTFLKVDSVMDLLADELAISFGVDKAAINRIESIMTSSRLRNLYTTSFTQQNRHCERIVKINDLETVLGNFSHLFGWEEMFKRIITTNVTIDEICFSIEFQRYMKTLEPYFTNVTNMELLLYSSFKAGQHLVNYWTLFEEHGSSFSRRTECYKLVHDNLREFVADIIRSKLFNRESDQILRNLSEIVRKSAANLMPDNAQDIGRIDYVVPEIYSTQQFDQIHREMPEMRNKGFLTNVLSLWNFKNQQEMKKIGPKKIDLVWEMDLLLSLKAQAAFVPSKQHIRIYPLLLALVSPEIGLSGATLPKPFKMATLGFAVAHEFSHVLHHFEEQNAASNYDLISNYWDLEAKRRECLIEKSQRFLGTTGSSNSNRNEYYDELMEPSDSYLNELWADVVGLRIAYDALVGQSSIENWQSLPGLSEFSHAQMFFLSFSQVFCSENELGQVRNGQQAWPGSGNYYQINHQRFNNQLMMSHPPNIVRAVLPLQLFEKTFSAAFQCQPSSLQYNQSNDGVGTCEI